MAGRRPAGPQATGLAGTIAALAAEGRLSPDADALVALAEGLARAVDASPENAALWREYRAAVAALLVVGADRADDDTAEFLVTISTPGQPAAGAGAARPARGGLPAPVVDTEDAGPPVVRARRRSSRGADGPAADAVAAPGRRRGRGAGP